MTLKEYVEQNGYEVSDLTKEELKEVEKELEVVNRGGMILDGFFSDYTLLSRKIKGAR